MNKRSKMMNDFFDRKEELLRQKEQSDKIKREKFIKNVFDQASIEERYGKMTPEQQCNYMIDAQNFYSIANITGDTKSMEYWRKVREFLGC